MELKKGTGINMQLCFIPFWSGIEEDRKAPMRSTRFTLDQFHVVEEQITESQKTRLVNGRGSRFYNLELVSVVSSQTL